jgi:hypothetical protein
MSANRLKVAPLNRSNSGCSRARLASNANGDEPIISSSPSGKLAVAVGSSYHNRTMSPHALTGTTGRHTSRIAEIQVTVM